VGSSILRTGSQWTWLLLIPSSLNFKEGGCWPAAPQCKILHVLIPRIMSPTFPALGRFTYVWTYIAVVAAAAAAVLTVILTVPWTPLPEVTFTVPSANSTRRIFFFRPSLSRPAMDTPPLEAAQSSRTRSQFAMCCAAAAASLSTTDPWFRPQCKCSSVSAVLKTDWADRPLRLSLCSPSHNGHASYAQLRPPLSPMDKSWGADRGMIAVLPCPRPMLLEM